MRLQKLTDGNVRLSLLDPWKIRTLRNLPALADFSGHEAAERRLLPSPANDADLTPEMGMDWVEYVIPELRDSFARNLGTVMADLENIKLQVLEEPENKHPETVPLNGDQSQAEADPADEAGDHPESRAGNGDVPPGADKGIREHGETAEPSAGEVPQKTVIPDQEPPHHDAGVESHEDTEDEDSVAGGTSSSPPVPPVSPAPEPRWELFTLDIPAEHAEQWFRAMNQARLVLSVKHGFDSEYFPDLASLLLAGKLEHWFQYELFSSFQAWLMDEVIDPG